MSTRAQRWTLRLSGFLGGLALAQATLDHHLLAAVYLFAAAWLVALVLYAASP